ncbi:MAG: TraB/GumN family protein [bacterium]|nr:TraB/GumN family protein [bacterium]
MFQSTTYVRSSWRLTTLSPLVMGMLLTGATTLCWSQDGKPPQPYKPTSNLDNESFKAEVQAFLDQNSPRPADDTNAASGESISGSSSPTGQAKEQSNSTQFEFLRLRSEQGEPRSLDTAVASYRSPNQGDIQVDLIGAVHVGELEYYAALNQLFDSYDVLLYELVAPEGTQIPLGGKRPEAGFNPVGMMQDGIKNMLGLESQLEQIDYTKSHLVRADMSPNQIAEKMAERGDTAITLVLDTLADVMRQQNLASSNPQANNLLLSGDELTLADMIGNPLKMKRLLAQQFATTGSLDMAMGESLNQLLIVDRNAEALRGLQKQIVAGKKKIGIFYGAAHLPDMETRLMQDFGFVRSEVAWLPAWDLTRAKPTQLSESANLMLNLLKILE